MIEQFTLVQKAALLAGASVWATRAVPQAGVRSIWFADGPHGVRKQTGSADHLGLASSLPATCFPTAATVANSWDPQLVEALARALGREAAGQDVDVLNAPALNIKRSPLCGRNFEYLSEDPYLSGTLAAAYVRGIQSQGVAACPKHFAANSQELRRMASDSVVDERTLREVYLTAFEIVVRTARPWAIMSGYNKVNGTYSHENPFLLQRVLRDEWGFDGAVVSDWGGGNDPVAAVRAGGTLEMPSPGLDSADRILRAVASGELSEAELDVRVGEDLGLVRRVGPRRTPVVDEAAHHELARAVAQSSAVLLKNDDGLLPLPAGTRVAVVGDFARAPRYQGAGSSLVNPTRLVTTLDALPGSGLELVEFAPGYTRGGTIDPALVAQAVDAARRADVTLAYLGLDELSETEGRDRSHLRLPPNQVDLLAALADVSDRVVVVLSAGGVVEMPWLDDCAALLHCYLGGQAGAQAALDVVTGAVNPSGRLAETFPVRLEDTPARRYYPGDGATAQYREGPYVGYRYYTSAGVPVRFPFGFGLSYTTFAFSDLRLDLDGVRFTVENTGQRAGAEVAQLYVGPDPEGGRGVFRPVRELKGFVKVFLEPGERREIALDFDEYTFRHFSTRSNRWEVETGRYVVMVGSSVEDIHLSAVHHVLGTVEPLPSGWDDLRDYYSGEVADVPDAEFAALLGRPLPGERGGRRPLTANDPLLAMRDAPGALARVAHRVLAWRIRRADARGKPDLNALFVYAMPFRAMAKMTNGAVSTGMVEAILTVVNGHLVRGLGALVRAALHARRTTRRLERELAGVTAPAPAAPAVR